MPCLMFLWSILCSETRSGSVHRGRHRPWGNGSMNEFGGFLDVFVQDARRCPDHIKPWSSQNIPRSAVESARDSQIPRYPTPKNCVVKMQEPNLQNDLASDELQSAS